jgi:hypothetical protein
LEPPPPPLLLVRLATARDLAPLVARLDDLLVAFLAML